MAENQQFKKPDMTPLDLTEEEIEALAEVTEEDIIKAQSVYERAVSNRFINLLLAENGTD